MKTSSLILSIVVVIVSILAVVYITNIGNVSASVVTGSEYTSTSTNSIYAGTHQLIRTTAVAPGCTVGSVIIASSSATAFTVWNATSTTDVASTTLATFQANASNGTYTFDSACTRGIVMSFPAGFNGNVVLTHR